MSFFDSKEEVISIELTPYGKKLLSQGIFKPVFYTFHDDDVIYDIQFASAESELQISSSNRILEETPYLKPITRKESVEKTSRYIFDIIDENIEGSLIRNVIGNSSFNSDYKPAWLVNVLKGEIENFNTKFSSSNSDEPIDIPQINLKQTNYEVKKINSTDEKLPEDISFPDQTALRIIEDYILLEIQENNVDITGDSFDIEMFQVNNENEKETLERIYFKKAKEYVVDNILLDENELQKQFIDENLFTSDNYFNLLVDDEIDLEQISDEVRVPSIKTVKPPFGENC